MASTDALRASADGLLRPTHQPPHTSNQAHLKHLLPIRRRRPMFRAARSFDGRYAAADKAAPPPDAQRSLASGRGGRGGDRVLRTKGERRASQTRLRAQAVSARAELLMRAAAPLLVAATAALSSVAPASASRSIPFDLDPDRSLAVDLPITRQHTYRMAGKVRMLLLWVGREDVGTAVINWRGEGETSSVRAAHRIGSGKGAREAQQMGIPRRRDHAARTPLVVGLISQR